MRHTFTILITVLLGATFFSSCGSSGSTSKDTAVSGVLTDTIVHYNIIIAPDISNRINPALYPKAVKDEDIIRIIMGNIKNVLHKGRDTHQHDIFRVDLINKNLISLYGLNSSMLEINFHSFGNDQLKRIEFITGVNKADSLKLRQDLLTAEVERIYKKAHETSVGADIWSYLNSGYSESLLGPQLESVDLPEGNSRIVNTYRNILVILTDGYIETGFNNKADCNGNRCNYLAGSTVSSFRKSFKAIGNGDDLQGFFTDNAYGVIPVENNALNNSEVLVLELYDRSLTRGGVSTSTPTDAEILKLFWDDWLTRSKVKRHKIYPVAASLGDVEKAFKDFIGL